MQDFPANSARSRARSEATERPERIEQITSVAADQRHRGLGRRFKETFIGGDDARSVFEYMITDVFVPSIQDMVIEAFQSGVERWIKGGSRRRYRSSTSMDTAHVNYQSITSNRPTAATSASPRSLTRQARARHNFDEIIIHSRSEATDVLDRMFEWLSRYGRVTVAELYEMTGIASSHVDHKWGWTSLSGARLRRLNTGAYMLDLPEPIPLSA